MNVVAIAYGVYEVDLDGREELSCLFFTEEDAMDFIASEEDDTPGASADLVMRPVNVFEMKRTLASISEDARWTICEGGDQ